jgi:hypothetical protein
MMNLMMNWEDFSRILRSKYIWVSNHDEINQSLWDAMRIE